MREEKGITLVALLITIVVLIILAGISILSIQNNNILGRANEAVNKYKEEQKTENTFLESYDDKMDSFFSETGKMITFTIDGVSYQTKQGITWREWAKSSEKWSVWTSERYGDIVGKEEYELYVTDRKETAEGRA